MVQLTLIYGCIFSLNPTDDTEVIRAYRDSDAGALLGIINALVEEDAPMLPTEPSSLEKVKQGFAEARIEKGEIISLVAEVDGKVIGECHVGKGKFRSSHVGTLGMGILKDYRERGIGTRLTLSVINKARASGLKIVQLEVMANNFSAVHLYERVGFRHTGVIPKKFFFRENYVDSLLMVKEL